MFRTTPKYICIVLLLVAMATAQDDYLFNDQIKDDRPAFPRAKKCDGVVCPPG
jgi:hypothetical protein